MNVRSFTSAVNGFLEESVSLAIIRGFQRVGTSTELDQRLHEAALDLPAVATGTHSGDIIGLHAHLDKDGTFDRVGQMTRVRDVTLRSDKSCIVEAASFGNRDKIDAGIRVTRLHAGLAVMAIVQDKHGEICRLLDANGGEAAQAHQHLAVTGDHSDATFGLRKRKTEADHGSTAHRTPKIEVECMVPRGGDIVGGSAQTRHDEKTAALLQQLFDEVAAIKHQR